VVVTGASTGIGFATTSLLVERGYAVVATVRRAEDAARLEVECGPHVHPLLMDVTDPASIQAMAQVTAGLVGERGVYGLVNNAGISVTGPLMHLRPEDLRRQFDVNVFGVMAVTQALLPLMGSDFQQPYPPGRIVNVSSVSGHMTYPFLAPYAASKHALEALSDGLRRELVLYGIDVVLIVLGAVDTPIWDKLDADAVERYRQTDYGHSLEKLLATTVQTGRSGMSPARAAAAIIKALETPKPQARYVVVNNYVRGWLVPRLLPTRLFDWAIAKQLGLEPPKARG
jgi:NAD(P)-dependent dehydrogenase (short-subunit alcohol dehydrogenase family)